MKNLKNIKQLKLANINLITQNQCTNQTKIRMMINGTIIVTPVLPKWKLAIFENNIRYYSTNNHKDTNKEPEQIKLDIENKLIEKIDQQIQELNKKISEATSKQISMRLNQKKKELLDKKVKILTKRFIEQIRGRSIKDKKYNKKNEGHREVRTENLEMVLYRKPDLSLVKVIDNSYKENEDMKYFMKLIDNKKIEYLNKLPNNREAGGSLHLIEDDLKLNIENLKRFEEYYNKFKHVRLIINDVEKKEIDWLKRSLVNSYIEHEKELKEFKEDNVILDKRINDILEKRLENYDDKYITDIETIFYDGENNEDKYNLVMYYVYLNRLKQEFLWDIVRFYEQIGYLNKKYHKEWLKPGYWEEWFINTRNDNKEFIDMRIDNKELDKDIKEAFIESQFSCLPGGSKEGKIKVDNNELIKNLSYKDVTKGNYFKRYYLFFGKEIESREWFYIRDLITNKEIHKGLDELKNTPLHYEEVKDKKVKYEGIRDWSKENCEKVEFLGKYDFYRVYKYIDAEVIQPSEISSIVSNYLDSLKLVDKEKLVVYSTRCMIRGNVKSLDNQSMYKMAGKSCIHSHNINREQFSLQLLYNITKLLGTYEGYQYIDIILFSKEWLNNDEYERLKNVKKKDKKDIANLVDKKFVENSKKILKDVKETMKGVKGITCEGFINKIHNIIPEFKIDLNKTNFEEYTPIEIKDITKIKGIQNNCEILGEIGIDFKENNLIHTQYLIKSDILMQKITFGYNGIVNKGVFTGKRYEKLTLNYLYLLSSKDINSNKEINVIKHFALIDYLKNNGETLRYCMNEFSSWLVYNNMGRAYNYENIFKFPKFQQLARDFDKEEKFGTIDLETYLDENGNSVVYSAAAVIDGVDNHHAEYGNNQDEIIYNLFNHILNNEKNKIKVKRVKYFYAHNGSNFDFVFILKSLSKYSEFDIKVVLKDSSQIIEMKISKQFLRKEGLKTKDKITIILRDSMLFLNGSLDKLGKSFIPQIDNIRKGIYPYKFVNKNNLEYNGSVPSIDFFNNPKNLDTINQYNELVAIGNNCYDLRKETIKYNINDCIVLYKIMQKFKTIIYDNFDINIERSKTIPGLAIIIYLSNFYKLDYNIRVIKGDIENNIRSSYSGGFACVYDKEISNAYHYDMNSQYPYVMLNDMPTGNPIFSRSTNLNDYFGFVCAKIIMTDKVKTPLLYHKNELGNSVLNDKKEFIGWYFSEELKNYKDKGYDITILCGYKFHRTPNIFKGYVEHLYSLKESATLNNDLPLRQVVKLLLVSLFGRMGQKEIVDRAVIVSEEEANKITKVRHWTKKMELSKDKYLVIHQGWLDEELLALIDEKPERVNGLSKKRGVMSSVPIASAITSYGRMEITKYLMMDDIKVHYIVTDGITINKPLPNNLISTKLGGMKLEYTIKEGVILSVNTLAMITEDGKTIIKNKGFNSTDNTQLNYQDFKEVLAGRTIELNHKVWKPILKKGTVQINEQTFTLRNKEEKKKE